MPRSALLLLAACGRVGFDVAADGGSPLEDPGGTDAPRMFDGPPGSVTYQFGEGPSATHMNVTRDTYVSNEPGEPLFNFGGEDKARIERDSDERALIRFDVTAIPATATVLDASLTVELIQIPSAPSALDFHRVLESWEEGTESGAPGATNFVMRTAGQSWSTPGAGPTASSTVSVAQYTPTLLGAAAIPIPVAVVQDWVTNGGNFGLVIISTNDQSTRFTTSEGQLTGRPLLVVTFQP